jgi:hypothetical protein
MQRDGVAYALLEVGEPGLEVADALLLLVCEWLELRGLDLLESGSQRADILAGCSELVEDGDDLGIGAWHGANGVVAVYIGEGCLSIDLWVLLLTGCGLMELNAGELGGEEAELCGFDVANEVAEGGVEDGAGKGRWRERARRRDAYRLRIGRESIQVLHLRANA